MQTQTIPVKQIQFNPRQPRRTFDPAELQSLADSIQSVGLQQPITVEPCGEGYVLIMGERRLRAHQLLGLPTIEAWVRSPSEDSDKLVDALVENVQREDMSIIDQGLAYRTLRDEFGMSARAISKRTGIHESRVRYCLKVADLEPEVLELIEKHNVPISQEPLQAIYSVPKGETRVKFMQAIAPRGPSVKALTTAATKLNASLAEEKHQGKQPPAWSIAGKRAKPKTNLPAWGVLQQAGKLPPFEVFRAVTLQTCDDCALREIASEATCGECPLVQLCIKLQETAHV